MGECPRDLNVDDFIQWGLTFHQHQTINFRSIPVGTTDGDALLVAFDENRQSFPYESLIDAERDVLLQ